MDPELREKLANYNRGQKDRHETTTSAANKLYADRQLEKQKEYKIFLQDVNASLAVGHEKILVLIKQQHDTVKNKIEKIDEKIDEMSASANWRDVEVVRSTKQCGIDIEVMKSSIVAVNTELQALVSLEKTQWNQYETNHVQQQSQHTAAVEHRRTTYNTLFQSVNGLDKSLHNIIVICNSILHVYERFWLYMKGEKHDMATPVVQEHMCR